MGLSVFTPVNWQYLCLGPEACTLESRFGLAGKQKTAYAMRVGLVGSEMCIRDRCYTQ